MSPILVRPVREQLEHDRVIRLLQAKYKRKFEVAINPGNVQAMPVGTAPSQWYPDLVLQAPERGHKMLGVVEVETAESVNHLEAMSQWAAFSRLKAEFHLYLPAGSIDTARRLCTDLQIEVTEIWAYSALGDQLRFTLVQRSPQAAEARARTSEVKPRASETKPRPAEAKPRASETKPRPAEAKPRPAEAKPRTAAATATRSRATTARPKRPSTAVAAGARRKTAAKPAASAVRASSRGGRAAAKSAPASRAQKKRK